MRQVSIFIFSFLVWAFPVFGLYAATATITDIFSAFTDFLAGPLLTFLFSIAFLFFLYGIIKFFIIESGNEDGREAARRYIVWGLLGLVVIFSIWGIFEIIRKLLGVNVTHAPIIIDYMK